MASYSIVSTASTTTDSGKPTTSRPSDMTVSSVVDVGKPVLPRPSDKTVSSVVDVGKPVHERSADLTQSKFINGVVIPGDFRPVSVKVVDEEGNRLRRVTKLLAMNPFPAATRINGQGVGTLPLLQTTYTEFIAVASRDSAPGYAWYEGYVEDDTETEADNDVPNKIGPRDDQATIVLEKKLLKGLPADCGVSFGGSLHT